MAHHPAHGEESNEKGAMSNGVAIDGDVARRRSLFRPEEPMNIVAFSESIVMAKRGMSWHSLKLNMKPEQTHQ